MRRRWNGGGGLAVLLTVLLTALLPAAGRAVFGMTVGLWRHVDASDHGTRCVLRPGQILTVRLSERPGTGYSWYAARRDAASLVQMGEPTVVRRPGDGHTVGGAVDVVRWYRALAPGQSILELHYQRVFDAQPLRIWALHVVVEAAP